MNTPLLTFNAKSVSCDILEKTLVGRRDTVDKIYQNLKQHIALNSNYQSLVVAPRGSGKSHITKVLYCRLKNDPEISSKMIIAYMIEDEAGIASFMHMIIHILDALRRYEEPGSASISRYKDEISNMPFDDQERELRKLLLKVIGDKKLILLIENFDEIVSNLGKDAAALRDFMHEYDNISIIATAQSLTPELQNSKYPFYQFFDTYHLKRLSYEETMQLIEALTEIEEDLIIKEELKKALADEQNDLKAKIKAIYDLTYGNHRLIVHFFQFLKADLKAELSTVFIRQMNDLKSYYEQFIKNLSAQKQRIVQILSLNRSPLQPDEIAKKSFLPTNSITKQLSELYKEGYVDKHQEGKNAFYEINEPLMRICFEINESPHGIATLFVDFLKAIYDQTTLIEKYLTFEYGHILEPDKKTLYDREAKMYKLAVDREVKISKNIDREFADSKNKSGLISTAKKLAEIAKISQSISNPIAVNEKIEIYENNYGPDFDLYYYLGYAYYELDKTEEAIEMYKKAILINKNNSDVYYFLGNAYHEKGKNEEAIEVYTNAIKLEPFNSKPFYNLGVAYKKEGHIAGAIEMYKKTIAMDPTNANAYNNLGVAYKDVGKLEEAIEMYKMAIEIDPHYKKAYNNLGSVYGTIGEFEDAVNMFQKAIILDSNYSLAYNNLGKLYNRQGKTKESIEMYEKSIELNSTDSDTKNILGILFFEIGNIMKASEIFKLEKSHKLVANSLLIGFFSKPNLQSLIEQTIYLNEIFSNENIQDITIAQTILKYSKTFFDQLGIIASETALMIKNYLFKNLELPLSQKYYDVIYKYYLLKDKKAIYKLSKEERKVFLDLFINKS